MLPLYKMGEDEQQKTEPAVETLGPSASGEKSSNKAFSSISRELPEETLTDPHVARLILNENDTLRQEIVLLQEYKNKFHDKDKQAAVLEERIFRLKDGLNWRSLSATFGGLFLGLTPTVAKYIEWLIGCVVLGLILLLIAYLMPKK